MKQTKPYWYPATACSILPFFICLHFPNLVTKIILEYVISHHIPIVCVPPRAWLKLFPSDPHFVVITLTCPHIISRKIRNCDFEIM